MYPELLNVPDYIIEVLITPNISVDYPPPIYYCNLLSDYEFSEKLVKNLKPFGDLYDFRRKTTASEVRRSTPQVLQQPYIISLSYYSVELGVKFWEEGLAYAVIREASEDPIPFST